MNNIYPNPWDFSNSDKNLTSPNKKYRIEYSELYEIAMGAPIGGECFLISDDIKIKLSDFCSGPIIWNQDSSKIALPIWTKNRDQKIGVFDIESKTITLYKRKFRVLQLDSFINNKITGIDSPIFQTEIIEINTKTELIESITNLK